MRIDDPLMGIQSSRDARRSLLAEALILDRLCPNCTQHSTVLRSRASCSGKAALLVHCVRTGTDRERQFRVCAVKGGAFQWVQVPPGETLQPEATGAVMEVTKWLKPSV